ncbi:MAG TPA: phosphatidate cytidylyltransferase [Beijerinckiaceae bacterium]|jgi:phosphatidate cytidylyltransferase
MAENETSHAPAPAPAVPARPPASELGLRVASSLALAAVALLATWAGGWLFAGLWFLAAAAILCEWIAMAGVEPRLALQLTLGILLGGLGALAVVADTTPMDAFPFFAAAALACLCGRTAHDRRWAAAGFAYAAVIAIVPPLVREHPRLGLVAILWMFAVVWLTDIAAYFAGRRFGGPKLWPAVSPKKTWSGFLGGLAAAVMAGAAVVLVARQFGWEPPVPLGTVVLASAVASVASQLGDLGESALKRRFGAKDSGRLIPGHGGVMDRLDGFWAVAALMGLALAAAPMRQGWAAG